MAAVDDVDELIERYHQALGQLVNGNPEPLKEIYSHRDDVSFANPFGPVVRGRDEAARAAEGSASNYRDGEIVGFENVAKYVTPSSPTSWRWSATGPGLAAVRILAPWLCASLASSGPKMAPGSSRTVTQTP